MTKDSKKRKILLLLDTHGLIHRAYHALPSFTSRNGEPTGALYGLSTMILRAVKEFKPDYIAAAYDLPGPTFRHVTYEKYKAQRPEAEEDLIHQIKRAHDITKAFGIPEYSYSGFEADDVIGTIIEQTKKEKNLKTIIVSGDADMYQLVDDDRVVVYAMRKGIEDVVEYDEKKVIERYGFPPKSLPDYKGLKGDSSDNIIGVRGIGEKTATEIVKHFGSLDELYNKIESKGFKRPIFLKERVIGLLQANKEDAFFSKTLATIRRDVPISFEFSKKQYTIDYKTLREIFLDLGFTSLLKRIEPETFSLFSLPTNSEMSVAQTKAVVLHDITSNNEGNFWLDIKKHPFCYMLFSDKTFLVKGESAIWKFEKSFFKKSEKKWEVLFSEKTLVSFDIKLFLRMFLRLGIALPKKIYDCAVAVWAAESTVKAATSSDLFERLFPKLILSNNDEELLWHLPDLHERIMGITKERSVDHVLSDMEFPLIYVLARMEERGIVLDADFLKIFKKEIIDRISVLEREIHAISGNQFNINSPAQVGDILFRKLGAEGKIKKTKTGKISTRESELLKLSEKHPIIRLILEYRELAKLLSTYVDPLYRIAITRARAHTTFNQTGTVTGRLSSENPNLQNIPIRSTYGARVRNAFVATPEYVFATFDYAQIELKILASLANDEKMIHAFKNGVDIHRMTASEINRVPLNQVTKTMRDRAKAINFGIIFGMGIRQLAQTTSMTTEEARRFYQIYFEKFPHIQIYLERIKNAVKKDGFVSTYFGRKRFFDTALALEQRFLEAEMERMAVNAVIQGTDADIMKRAMIAIDRAFPDEDVIPILQIHDEMIYEINEKKARVIIPQIKKIFEKVVSLPTPLIVEVRIGKRWGELKSKEAV